MIRTLPITLALVFLAPNLAAAEGASQVAEAHQSDTAESDVDIEFGGYGEMAFSYLDFGENQNREGGALPDNRLVFDTTRLALKLEVELPWDVEAEAEIEFEHGGTGAALELEYEEFGEYEQEVEAGGEVVVEELYLKKSFGDFFSLALGRFYVAVGLLPDRHKPTDYLATGRPEAETTVLPGVWNEMGLQAQFYLPYTRVTAQLVNGLDSTGFSSQFWVSSGHQTRFELVRATGLAGVLRVDVTPVDDVTFGVSGYAGQTSANRPKADLVVECDNAPERVSGCGYVSAPVYIVDAHAAAEVGPVTVLTSVIYGHLKNAAAVSDRNGRLSNNLEVLRSPVSDNAFAAWAEVGVDTFYWTSIADMSLTPFVRFDYVDTQFQPREALFDNPRFERQNYAAGVAFDHSESWVLKLDFNHRRMGDDTLNHENMVRLQAGFSF